MSTWFGLGVHQVIATSAPRVHQSAQAEIVFNHMFRYKNVRQFTEHCGVFAKLGIFGRLITQKVLHLAGGGDRHLPTSKFSPDTICERITWEDWVVQNNMVHTVERFFQLLLLTRRKFVLPIFFLGTRRTSVFGEFIVVLYAIKTSFPCQLESGALNSPTSTRRHVTIDPLCKVFFVVSLLPRRDKFAKSQDAFTQ